MATPSAPDLFTALNVLIAIDDENGLFDRGAEEGGYRSEELERALDVIRAAISPDVHDAG